MNLREKKQRVPLTNFYLPKSKTRLISGVCCSVEPPADETLQPVHEHLHSYRDEMAVFYTCVVSFSLNVVGF